MGRGKSPQGKDAGLKGEGWMGCQGGSSRRFLFVQVSSSEAAADRAAYHTTRDTMRAGVLQVGRGRNAWEKESGLKPGTGWGVRGLLEA